MKTPHVVRQEGRLDNLFVLAKALPITEVERKAHWARYLCILVSGYIETSVKSLLSTYAKNRANPRVANYVEQQLRWFQNPKMGKILDLVSTFGLDWRATLEGSTTEAQQESVNSVVTIRHLLAHGEDSGISLVTIEQHYKNAKKVVEQIGVLCDR